MNFAEGALRIVDRAEHGEGDDGVERVVLEGQRLGGASTRVTSRPMSVGPTSCAPQHRFRRIDGDELLDLGKVREAEAGADTDLEHAPSRAGEQLGFHLGAERLFRTHAQGVVDRGKESFA